MYFATNFSSTNISFAASTGLSSIKQWGIPFRRYFHAGMSDVNRLSGADQTDSCCSPIGKVAAGEEMYSLSNCRRASLRMFQARPSMLISSRCGVSSFFSQSPAVSAVPTSRNSMAGMVCENSSNRNLGSAVGGLRLNILSIFRSFNNALLIVSHFIHTPRRNCNGI